MLQFSYMEEEKKRFMLLLGGGVVTALVLFAISISVITSDGEATFGLPITSGEAEVVPERSVTANTWPSPVVPSDTWQDELTVYEIEDEERVPAETPTPIPAQTEAQTPPSVAATYTAPVIEYGIVTPVTWYVPPTKPIVIPEMVSTPIPPVTEAPIVPIKTLSARFDSCGTFTVPASGSMMMIGSAAASDETTICMGESIADSCNNASARISVPGGESVRLYVLDREDDVCAIGVEITEDEVLTCDVVKILNATESEPLTLSEWQARFDATPGVLFASIYLQNSNLFYSASNVAAYDCISYRL